MMSLFRSRSQAPARPMSGVPCPASTIAALGLVPWEIASPSSRENSVLTIADKFRSHVTEQARLWHQWSSDIAAGRAAPSPAAVLNAAAVLGHDQPAEQLEADAAVLAEVSRLERLAVDLAAELKSKLRPWGGSLEKLDAELAAAERRAKEIRDFRQQWSWGCADDTAAEAADLRRKNPHLFPLEIAR